MPDDPNAPPPMNRRAEDTRSYAVPWTVTLGGVLVWASSFLLPLAGYETFGDIYTDYSRPKMLVPLFLQIIGYIGGVLGASQLPSKSIPGFRK